MASLDAKSSSSSYLLYFCVVSLRNVAGGKRELELSNRFRVGDASVDLSGSEPVLKAFAAPLGPESIPAKEYMASEEYTFTLTHGDGKRFQGFCRKFLPPPPRIGSKLRFPQVICIVSEYPWCSFYFKVLQVLEQLIRSGDLPLDGTVPRELPAQSHASAFLRELGGHLSRDPVYGEVISIALPKSMGGLIGVSPPRLMGGDSNDALAWSDDHLELQIPPDSGNGRWNCGLSLARLLWHVPVAAMMTLIASMLLERRIIIVGQSRDTVTAAVQAAAALLYPFRWHHIYLPLLPKQLQDYLTAPMPFMVGMPAQMLPMLKQLSVDEVTIVDLDLGTCDPAPNSARDDSVHLPWRDRLEAALTAAYGNLKSPTEHESSPVIAAIMQEYLLKLLGHYRQYIHEDRPGAGPTPPQSPLGPLSSTSRPPMAPSHSLPASPAPGGRAGNGGDAGPSGRGFGDDNALKGHGMVFEHAAFMAYHRQNEKARRFLSMFRHSQMFEVFIQEKLLLATQQYHTEDAFEKRLVSYQERRQHRYSQMQHPGRASPAAVYTGAAATGGPNNGTPSKWSAMLKLHHRSSSEEALAAMGRQQQQQQQAHDPAMRRITTDPAPFRTDAGSPSPSTRKSPLSLHPGTTTIDPARFFEDDHDLLRGDLQGTPLDAFDGFSRSSLPPQIPHSPMTDDSSLGHMPDSLRSKSVASFKHSFSPQPPTAPSHPERDLARASVPVALEFRSPGGSGASEESGSKKGGIVLSFQSGTKHYEGNFTSVMKAMWSDAKNKVGMSVSGSGGVDSPEPSRGDYQGGGAAAVRVSAGAVADSGTPYRRQTTGDGKPESQGLVQRYTPQSTGGGIGGSSDGGRSGFTPQQHTPPITPTRHQQQQQPETPLPSPFSSIPVPPAADSVSRLRIPPPPPRPLISQQHSQQQQQQQQLDLPPVASLSLGEQSSTGSSLAGFGSGLMASPQLGRLNPQGQPLAGEANASGPPAAGRVPGGADWDPFGLSG